MSQYVYIYIYTYNIHMYQDVSGYLATSEARMLTQLVSRQRVALWTYRGSHVDFLGVVVGHICSRKLSPPHTGTNNKVRPGRVRPFLCLFLCLFLCPSPENKKKHASMWLITSSDSASLSSFCTILLKKNSSGLWCKF